MSMQGRSVQCTFDLELLDFKKGGGLLPAVVQDADTGAVLMLGYMNREALQATFQRGRVVFWSRSKQRLWMKGERSGNFLNVVDMRVDCDGDTLLVKANPVGPACHRGTITCFGNEVPAIAGSAAGGEDVRAIGGGGVHGEPLGFLTTLETIIERRVAENPEGSYTARLFAQGPKRIAQKVGEEGLEVALAGVVETDDKVIAESADLLFHLLVLLKSRGVALNQVVSELESRHTAKSSG